VAAPRLSVVAARTVTAITRASPICVSTHELEWLGRVPGGLRDFSFLTTLRSLRLVLSYSFNESEMYLTMADPAAVRPPRAEHG